MKIFGLRPVSNWDRAENLVKLASNRESKLLSVGPNRYKYYVPKNEQENLVSHTMLINKYLPKAINEMLSKIRKG